MKRTFWIFLFLTLSLMAVIFCFSSQVGEKSSKISSDMTSKIVTEEAREELPRNEYNKKFEIVETVIRKSAHGFIFLSLGFCSFMTLYYSDKMHKKYILFIATIVFCIFYATTDEIHQLFVSERSGEVRDVIIDSLGSLTGIFIALGLLKIKKKSKNNHV